LQSRSQTAESLRTIFALNEVFAAEKNVGLCSIYRLKADNHYVGKFKSSGLLICTGTGSTGWLHSAKRVTYNDVEACLRHLGLQECEDTINGIATELSKTTVFDEKDPQMYYYVREPQKEREFEAGK